MSSHQYMEGNLHILGKLYINELNKSDFILNFYHKQDSVCKSLPSLYLVRGHVKWVSGSLVCIKRHSDKVGDR